MCSAAWRLASRRGLLERSEGADVNERLGLVTVDADATIDAQVDTHSMALRHVA
jgi:hypothetical protein